MSKKRKIDYHEFDAPEIGEDPNIGPAASATELTGLLYRTPATPQERQNAQALEPMEVERGKEHRPRTKDGSSQGMERD